MAALKYRDEHNKVGFLEKPKGSADYHQVLDFLWGSHIRASEEGPPAILATIDRTPYTITESLVRSQLQLDDNDGVEDLPIADIYLGMDNLGYPTEGKLTFHKNKFSPQWRFLVHTILHCLSTKSGSWDQFGSQVAIALICLTEGRRYNWSSYIFKGMVNNINNPKKFLLFPRFLQMILEIEPKITKQYHAFKIDTAKMFANMRLNFQGDHMPLLGTMLPPAQAAIAGESSGEAAPSNPQTVPETINEPDHSHDHVSTPPDNTNTSSALSAMAGFLLRPNVASSSTQALPKGTTSGGAEDLDKTTALSSLMDPLFKLAKGSYAVQLFLLVVLYDANIPPFSSSIPSDKFAGDPSKSEKGTLDKIEEDMLAHTSQFVKKLLGRMYEEEQAIYELERGDAEEHAEETTQDCDFTADRLGPECQMKDNFAKRIATVAELTSLNIRRSLKGHGADLEQAGSKKSKPTEAPKSSVPNESQQPSACSSTLPTQHPSEFSSQPTVLSAEPRTHSYGTRRKSLGARKKSSTELDLTADDRQILYLVDRKDLFKLYGWLVRYFEGASSSGPGTGVGLGKHQQQWVIRSWRSFPFSGVHVLETISGKILYMFADTPYPLSAQLMKKMLKHKLEVEIDRTGNDMTYAEQLIQFIKNQVAASIPST
ncbi:hypothetical protein Tco_1082414 [Tanacetum coccineum]|uniref:Synaptobrevin, longin-like domain protein n=1 Tax=Tanacetum coccineum TaxID=301880 RepID=A0ABQ5I1L1_9ASTR